MHVTVRNTAPSDRLSNSPVVFPFPHFLPLRRPTSARLTRPPGARLSKNVVRTTLPTRKHCFPSPKKRSLTCVYQSAPGPSVQECLSPSPSIPRPTQNTSPTSIICALRPKCSRIPSALFPVYPFLSVRDTHSREFSLPQMFTFQTFYSNDKATQSRSENYLRHPYPSKLSKGSRPGPGPVTREGVLTNTRRFLERMVARAEL